MNAGFELAKAATPYLRESKSGSLVFISSQIGLVGHRRAAAYAASKSAINGLTRSMALELACYNLRVNAVAPGPVATAGGHSPRQPRARECARRKQPRTSPPSTARARGRPSSVSSTCVDGDALGERGIRGENDGVWCSSLCGAFCVACPRRERKRVPCFLLGFSSNRFHPGRLGSPT